MSETWQSFGRKWQGWWEQKAVRTEVRIHEALQPSRASNCQPCPWSPSSLPQGLFLSPSLSFLFLFHSSPLLPQTWNVIWEPSPSTPHWLSKMHLKKTPSISFLPRFQARKRKDQDGTKGDGISLETVLFCFKMISAVKKHIVYLFLSDINFPFTKQVTSRNVC